MKLKVKIYECGILANGRTFFTVSVNSFFEVVIHDFFLKIVIFAKNWLILISPWKSLKTTKICRTGVNIGTVPFNIVANMGPI